MKKILYVFGTLCILLGSDKLFAQAPVISGPTNVCIGQTYTYTFSYSSCYLQWSTTCGDIIVDGINNHQSFYDKLDDPSTIQITWTSIGANAVNVIDCNDKPRTLAISANDFPLSITPNVPAISAGYSVTLAASTATSYAWSCTTGNCISGSATTQTVTATPSTTTTYTVTAQMKFYLNNQFAVSCTKSASAVVTVNSNPIVGNSICCDQSFCASGGDPTIMGQQPGTSLTGGIGTYSYQWQVSINGGLTWSNISGATSAMYDSGIITATTMFKRIVNSGTLQGNSSNIATVNIVPNVINLGSTTYTSTTAVKANVVNITGNIATSSGTSIVDIKAGGYVLINPGSIISSTSVLEIGSCTNGLRLAKQELNTDQEEVKEAETIGLVYPNPISEGILHFGQNVSLYKIFDSSGALVKEGANADGVEINGLNKGLFFLRRDGVGSKFIIQ